MRVFIAAVLLLFAAAYARAETVSLAEYRQRIASCRAALAASKTDTRAVESLAKVRSVILPDDEQIGVQNKTLQAALEQGNVRRARALLDTLLVWTRPSAQTTSVHPQQQAAQLLARDEFQRLRSPEKPRSTWQKWREQWQEKLRRFLRRLFSASPALSNTGGNTVGALVLGILYFVAAVAALVGIYFLAPVLRTVWRRKQRRDAALEQALAHETGTFLHQAQQHADAGAFRQAVRCVYLACLQRLHFAGLIVVATGKTNWHYQRALNRRAPDAAQTLLPLTQAFDRIWYGQNQAKPSDYENAIAIFHALPPAKAPTGKGAML